MQVTLRKNITTENKINLNKGDKGIVRAVSFGKDTDDTYYIAAGGADMVPVSRNDLDFPKATVTIKGA